MNRKVIDILPPKKTEKESSFVPQEEKEDQFLVKKPELRISSPVKKFLIPGIIILIFVFSYFNLSKAEIEVWPEREVMSFKTKLTIDKKEEQTDPVLWVKSESIPGELFKKEKTITKTFSSSGRVLKEEKAEGLIKVYNEYSTSPQILIATTRFVSAEGKLFRTPIKVTIPGGSYEGGKFVPGSIDIKVVADQPGPEYNIGPSTFSIPGFAGTARYTKFYAKSFQSMEGGISQEVFQITQKDLEQAENILTEEVKKDSQTALKNDLEEEKFSSEYSFLEESIQTEIVEKFSLAKAREEAEDFKFQVKAESETLIFKKEDLKNFVKEFISLQIPQEKKLYEESLEINFVPETINLAAGKIILSLDVSAKIYSDIDIVIFKNALMGKSLTETKFFLEEQPEITKVRVQFWPFWVQKVPEKKEKINFELNLD